MKKLITFLLLTITLSLHAQTELTKMKVEGKPYLSETEIVARRTPDGRFCAGLQIISDLDGFSYDSYLSVVGGIEDKPGRDIIYVDPAERAVLLYHVGYEPLKIILSEIGIQLKEKQMWVIRIRGGKVDILIVSFITEPPVTEFLIDGKNLGLGPTFKLKNGHHTIEIRKRNYMTIIDTINVDFNHALFRYQLIFHPTMVFITGGTFEMGDIFGEGGDYEKPVHNVKVDSFLMSPFEVTFADYDDFCEATGREKPNDNGWGRGLHPVMNVSWYDAIEYCNWLSKEEGLSTCYKINKSTKDSNNKNEYDAKKWLVECDFTADGYRLPTEAEWEYTAREGGKRVRFGNGKNIADPEEINIATIEKSKSQSGWFVFNGKAERVGSYHHNRLQLYDMSGNVAEWCWNWHASYQLGVQNNPLGPTYGRSRVTRGGSWKDFGDSIDAHNELRTASRTAEQADTELFYIGFRICRSK